MGRKIPKKCGWLALLILVSLFIINLVSFYMMTQLTISTHILLLIAYNSESLYVGVLIYQCGLMRSWKLTGEKNENTANAYTEKKRVVNTLIGTGGILALFSIICILQASLTGIIIRTIWAAIGAYALGVISLFAADRTGRVLPLKFGRVLMLTSIIELVAEIIAFVPIYYGAGISIGNLIAAEMAFLILLPSGLVYAGLLASRCYQYGHSISQKKEEA